MDPLSLVRDFNIRKQADLIQIKGDKVDFAGRYEFPKNSFTAFRTTTDYATLEAVLFVLKHRDTTQVTYLQLCRANGILPVPFTEKKRLLDFLDGKTKQLETGPGIPGLTPGAASAPAQQAKQAAIPGLQPQVSTPVQERVQARATRQLRDRNSMLLAPNKDFKFVLDIANKAHAQLSALFKQAHAEDPKFKAGRPTSQPNGSQHNKPAQAPGGGVGVVPLVKPSGRFERDTTSEALRAFGGEAAAGMKDVIDMYGSYPADRPAPQAPPQAAAPAPAPAAAPPPPAPAPPGHHSSSQRPTGGSRPPPPAGGQSALGKRAHDGQGAEQARQRPVHGKGDSKRPDKAASTANRVPLILVPTSVSAMITMHNAKQFLEQATYVKPDVTKPKETSVTFKRVVGKPAGTSVPYEITDKAPSKQDAEGWARVAAVIVSGQKWQFKEWPFKGAAAGDMLETFSRVAGFYVHFTDEKVPDTVSNWNVKTLGLAREKRHLDMTCVLQLYQHLDAFLGARHSQLTY